MRKVVLWLLVALVPVLALPNVALLTTSSDYSGILGALDGDAEIGSVTYLDGRNTTPTVAELQNYACVLAFSNNTWNNQSDMGDNLADYVDLGGSVVLGTAVFESDSDLQLLGRITEDATYAPLTQGSSNFSYTNLGSDSGHAIMDGVNSIHNGYFWSMIDTESGAEWIADWTNGYALAAINANENCVGLNIFYDGGHDWTDDGYPLAVNSVNYLVDANKPVLETVEVLADTGVVVLTFDKDTNEPTIDETNIDTVFALDDGTRGGGFGEVRALRPVDSPAAPHSWLSGSGALGGAVWTDAATLEITLSMDGGKPTLAVGDTVIVDDATVQLADVNNPCDSEATVTGDFGGWNVVPSSWGWIKHLD